MAAGDTGLSAVDSSDFLSDVSYSGLSDSSFGFSGDSSLEDFVGLQDPLQLDTSSGDSILSSYDLFGKNDPTTSLALSGVSDPPFASINQSSPYGNGVGLSPSTSSAFSFLSKLGSTFSSLVGGTSRAVSPAPMPISQSRTGYTPVSSANGTSLALLLVIVGAAALLILRGSD